MKTWKTLSVKEFQQILNIQKSSDDDFEKRVKIINTLEGTDITQTEDLSWNDFKNLEIKASFIFKKIPESKLIKRIKLNGRLYKINYDIRNINLNNFVTSNHFINEGAVENMHKIVACLFERKYRWYQKKKKRDYEQICEDILNADFVKIHAVYVFFYQLYQNAITELIPFLEKELIKTMETQEIKKVTSLIKDSVGSTMLNL